MNTRIGEGFPTAHDLACDIQEWIREWILERLCGSGVEYEDTGSRAWWALGVSLRHTLDKWLGDLENGRWD